MFSLGVQDTYWIDKYDGKEDSSHKSQKSITQHQAYMEIVECEKRLATISDGEMSKKIKNKKYCTTKKCK